MASAEVPKVNPNDPHVRRLVYNMYRDMLGSYNHQANTMVESLPKFIVSEDEGVVKKLEEIIKQSNLGSPECVAPPAPPPPPSFPTGTWPGKRLNTDLPERSNEPPAAIQNAMMTKDKKPFTYTPGGLDLSQIKSPRMQKRISRNAEGGGEPAPTTIHTATGPMPAAAIAAMQPQTAVPVFPPPPPPPPPSGGIPPPPPLQSLNNQQYKPPQGVPKTKPQPQGFDPNEILSRRPKYQDSNDENDAGPGRIFVPQVPKPVEPANVYIPSTPVNVTPPIRNEPGSIYVPPVVKNEPGSIYVPPVPAQQNRAQLGSIYIPSVPVDVSHQDISTPSSASSQGYIVQTPGSASSGTPSSPVVLNKAPTPWLTQNRVLQNLQNTVPPWASNARNENEQKGGSRVIPIQLEGRDTPTNVQQNQRQVNSPQQQNQRQVNSPHQRLANSPQQQQQQPGTRIIPIQLEGGGIVGQQSPTAQIDRRTPQNKFNPMTPQSPTPYSPSNMADGEQPQWAPVQSRSFKVLQKMTDTDSPDGQCSPTNRPVPPPPQRQPQPSGVEYGSYNTAGVPLSQLRKMQLSDDDRALMEKFKAQADNHSTGNTEPRFNGSGIPSRVFKLLDSSVDDENYLHKEADPRYRGPAIPSRAFRMLQNMTDTAGDYPDPVPRGPSRGPANRLAQSNQYTNESPQSATYVPPSEQQVQEPRKYTGGSIPSRSFKMLQASIGQGGNAPNQMSGRETPASNSPNNWGPSPAPSPIDPYWGYYPPDPYVIYNYISDMNAAYGFPSHPSVYHQQSYPPYQYPPPRYPPPNYFSDSDEQGYSSTDEMAQYYHNYLMNFGYPPYQPNPDPYYQGRLEEEAPKTPRIVITPSNDPEKKDKSARKKSLPEEVVKEKPEKIINNKPEINNKQVEKEDSSEEESSEEETDTDTEVEEDGEKKKKTSSQKLNHSGNLQALKSVSDVNIYTSESSATVTNDEWEDCDSKIGDEDEDEEEEEESESLEEEEAQPREPDLPHQLSVIFEESECSDVESIRRANSMKSETYTSEDGDSTATFDNEEEEEDEDEETDEEVLHSESSVTVRLPLQLKFSRSDNDEDVTTVIVGDSQMKHELISPEEVKQEEPVVITPEVLTTTTTTTAAAAEEEDKDDSNDDEDGYETDDADVSFTFSIPNRTKTENTSNNEGEIIKQIEPSEVQPKEDKSNQLRDTIEPVSLIETQETVAESTPSSPIIDTEVTVSVSLPFKKKKERRDDVDDSRTEESDSTHCEDDSSSTSFQSVDTVVKQKEDTEDEDDTMELPTEVSDTKNMIQSFSSWMEKRNSKDWSNETEKTGVERKTDSSDRGNLTYEAGVGQLENMISSLLQKTKDTFDNKPDETCKSTEPNIELEDKGKSENACADINQDDDKKEESLARKQMKKESSQEESEEDDSGVTSDMSGGKPHNSETDDTESEFTELSKMSKCQRASTHSRLFKLLQDECEKSDDEGENENEIESETTDDSTLHLEKTEESLSSRKERLTLPLSQSSNEVDSLSSSSGVTSPSSPTVTDRLVKELVQSLLNKKKGKKFKKLPLDKLHAAALRILQEDMDPYDTSSASGDDGFFLSPVHKRHSQNTADSPTFRSQIESMHPDNIYGDHYYDYLDYYNTWGNPEYYCQEYEVVPSRAFHMLNHPMHQSMMHAAMMEGYRAKCPRMVNPPMMMAHHMMAEKPTSPNGVREPPPMSYLQRNDSMEPMLTFSQKQEMVSKVLEKSSK